MHAVLYYKFFRWFLTGSVLLTCKRFNSLSNRLAITANPAGERRSSQIRMHMCISYLVAHEDMKFGCAFASKIRPRMRISNYDTHAHSDAHGYLKFGCVCASASQIRMRIMRISKIGCTCACPTLVLSVHFVSTHSASLCLRLTNFCGLYM